VDVAPARAAPLELLAQLAHEDVDRTVAVGHGIAPDPLVDALPLEHLTLRGGEEMEELELAPGEVERAAGDEGLELVRPNLQLARHQGAGLGAGLAAAPAPGDRLHAGDELLGMAGLGDPVVGAQPQPAHPLGDRGLARADQDPEAGQG
jgi:hypothetical protein